MEAASLKVEKELDVKEATNGDAEKDVEATKRKTGTFNVTEEKM